METPNFDMQNIFRATFNTPTGTKVLSELIERTGFLNYVSPDATGLQYARWEGERSIILFILEKLGLKESESIARILLSVPVEAPEEEPEIKEEVF